MKYDIVQSRSTVGLWTTWVGSGSDARRQVRISCPETATNAWFGEKMWNCAYGSGIFSFVSIRRDVGPG